jgi:hypothetical protein
MAATLDAGPSASLAREKRSRPSALFRASDDLGREVCRELYMRATSSGLDCYVTVLEWFGTNPTGCYIIPLCHFSRLRF